MDADRPMRLADDLVRRLAAAIRGAQLYSPGHPLVTRALGALAETSSQLLADQPSITIGIVGFDIVVGELVLPKSRETYGELIRRVKRLGIERITFDRGVTPDEIATLVLTTSHPERAAGKDAPGIEPSDALEALQNLPHIRVGRIQLEERVDTSAADIAAIRRLYAQASTVAEEVWEAAKHEGTPDPREARNLIEQLSQAVAQNRTALLALTALKEYDNYTFTHMVNVSILTMAQARALGIDGGLLREFGLAGLMHDIGKVRTPAEILRKPDRLTDSEMNVMRRHVVDGAEILRRTPEIPSIAPVVAFEHHLRSDGTGYPVGVSRPKLNLATMLCSIADVYDAMRSQRAYQGSLPTERILEVMKRADGHQFDQHLVRRFTQLLGIYPPGNLVLLDDGAVAVVLQVHAPDPHRPRVRVIMDGKRRRLLTPVDINLFEEQSDPAKARKVVAPLDPSEYAIDPLTYL
jgi:putative nucleotidyltransferase with HDIG domain